MPRRDSIHPHSSRPGNLVPTTAFRALVCLFLVNLSLQTFVEPDFGWHLRTGLDLLRNGGRLPPTDPYSHTMPDWPWVEHAWLTDLIMGLTYEALGPLAVIALFAAATLAAFAVISALSTETWTPRLVAIAGALWVARPYLGTRTQVVTLLGLAATWWLVTRFQRGDRWTLWLLPPLFALWANLHGGFPAGLLVLGLVFAASCGLRLLAARWPGLAAHVSEPLMTWGQLLQLAVVGLSSAAATLINPYGWRLHQEILLSLSDRFMLETLQEWRPVSLSVGAGRSYAVYLSALGLLALAGYRQVEPVRWCVWVVFLVASLLHWRNVFVFLLLSVPLAADLLAEVFRRVGLVAGGGWPAVSRALAMAGTLAAGALVAQLGVEHLHQVLYAGLDPRGYFRTTDYPIEAVDWIRTQPAPLGRALYNEYGHGGFLLWWLPEKKIFIDGRMPAWRIGNRNIFADYLALSASDPPDPSVLDKYNVDWAIMTVDSLLARYLAHDTRWEAVYRDRKVTIYVRARGDV